MLSCNLHPSNLNWILSPQAIVPPFWRELFTFWFNQFYIPPNCTDDVKKDKVLNVPVTYNSSISSPRLLRCQNMPEIHAFLSDNAILLLKDFLREFHNFIPHVTLVSTSLAPWLQELFQCIPQLWCNHVVHCNFSTNQCLITDRLFAGLMPTKTFTELLLPHPVNNSAITHWEKDLECTIEGFLWQNICKKIKLLSSPLFRDFHTQLLNQVFPLNVLMSLYREEISPVCSFCSLVEETYPHLFWDCKYVFPIWTAIQDICYDTIDEEDFSMFKCLLSNFQNPLLNLVTVIVKYHVHICRIQNSLPTVSGILHLLCKERDTYFHRAQIKNTLHLYNKFWDVWTNDIVVNEIVKTWQLLDNR